MINFSRKTFLFSILLLVPGLAGAQAWEKIIAPGLTYRMEVDLGTPRLIYALRYSPKAPLIKVTPESGATTLVNDSPTRGKGPVSEIVKRVGGIAGLNSDFFGESGDPLGFMVKGGTLISAPHPKRAYFAWGKEGQQFATCTLTLSIRSEGMPATDIYGINSTCGENMMILNTPATGVAQGHPGYIHVILSAPGALWPATGSVKATVVRLVGDQNSVPVPADGAVLTCSGTKTVIGTSFKPGQEVVIESKCVGYDPDKFENAIAGGPFLLKEGKVSVDATQAGFTPGFAERRHPRSAIGRTVNGDLWFVAVDGRQKMSDGATLEEMAGIMLRLGCVDAINVDGGGSTDMNILGLVMNRPSDGRERPVANALVFSGPQIPLDPAVYSIRAPGTLSPGSGAVLAVLDEKGQSVPNSEVIWSAPFGPGWIDQGGLLHAMEAGTARVYAFVRGQMLTVDVPIG